MVRCPSCGARREETDDYCPVCGETLTKVHFSEASGPRWYERTGVLLGLVLLVWPIALYGLSKREPDTPRLNVLILTGCAVMAVLWAVFLGLT